MIGQATYTLAFYFLAAASVLLALAVVNERKLLRAAVALMGVLTVSAGLYAMLGAEFLAGVQVLVYVGGIVVLIVFAIMLTRSAELLEDRPDKLRSALGAVLSIGFLGSVVWVLKSSTFALPAAAPLAPHDDAREIGVLLLNYTSTGYVLPFEIISLLLLAAVIGGIVVARKTAPAEQPFTSGGDLAGEADFEVPRTQHDEAETGVRQ
ncbi:MAG: NADH-quinone oxidoreductase subunit J [FCB group bacterium]|jgi:NADH-quinone oxidoreductase subunit J|nr:NADH-quinone oxidoreductase subunit J [FCB group bacterium]